MTEAHNVKGLERRLERALRLVRTAHNKAGRAITNPKTDDMEWHKARAVQEALAPILRVLSE
jgi:hypothetical protein